MTALASETYFEDISDTKPVSASSGERIISRPTYAVSFCFELLIRKSCKDHVEHFGRDSNMDFTFSIDISHYPY